MSKEAHVYIYGEVYNSQSSLNKEFGIVSLSDVQAAISSVPDYEKVVVHIHSPGGSVTEGLAIYDYLRSLRKEVITIAEGLCGSIASVIALAGETRLMFENSTYFVHYPSGFAMGTADDIKWYEEMLRKYEDRLVSIYVERTGISEETLRDMLSKQTALMSEEAIANGFMTAVFKAEEVLALQFEQILAHMTAKPNKTSIMEKINAMLGLGKKEETTPPASGATEEPKALVLTAADGRLINFETENDFVSVNDKATIDGSKPEDGELVMSTGETLVITDGVVTEIKQKEDPNAKMIEELRAELVTVQNKVAELNSALEQERAEHVRVLEELKNDISSLEVVDSEQTFRAQKGGDEKLTPVQAALKRKQEAEAKAKETETK